MGKRWELGIGYWELGYWVLDPNNSIQRASKVLIAC
jgi:hypothetical protein